MAYIRTEEVKAIRDTLKAAFPEFKFAVRREHHSAVEVNIMEGPMDLNKDIYINEYHYMSQLNDRPELVDLIEGIITIVKNAGQEWYDRSDSMTDYFDTAFYFYVKIGKWDRDYVVNTKKLSKATKGTYTERAKTALAFTKLEA